MTPRELECLVVAVGRDVGVFTADGPPPGSVVRAAPGGPRWWRVVLPGRVGAEGGAALRDALSSRPEVSGASWVSTPAGPFDVELTGQAFADALRTEHLRAVQPAVSPAVRRSGSAGDDAREQARLGADPWRAARYAHSRAVRRAVLARRVGVRPVVLPAAATAEQLDLVGGVLDTDGALGRAASASRRRQDRIIEAHLSALTARSRAAFDAAPSRPLGEAPVTAAHGFAAFVDTLAAAALARTLHALGQGAPGRY